MRPDGAEVEVLGGSGLAVALRADGKCVDPTKGGWGIKREGK